MVNQTPHSAERTMTASSVASPAPKLYSLTYLTQV